MTNAAELAELLSDRTINAPNDLLGDIIFLNECAKLDRDFVYHRNGLKLKSILGIIFFAVFVAAVAGLVAVNVTESLTPYYIALAVLIIAILAVIVVYFRAVDIARSAAKYSKPDRSPFSTSIAVRHTFVIADLIKQHNALIGPAIKRLRKITPGTEMDLVAELSNIGASATDIESLLERYAEHRSTSFIGSEGFDDTADLAFRQSILAAARGIARIKKVLA